MLLEGNECAQKEHPEENRAAEEDHDAGIGPPAVELVLDRHGQGDLLKLINTVVLVSIDECFGAVLN